jgi:hypothetical protein
MITANCRTYNSGITCKNNIHPHITNTTISSYGATDDESNNVGIYMRPDALAASIKGVEIYAGDASAPGTGILIAHLGGSGKFGIVDSKINTRGGTGINVEVGDIFIGIRSTKIANSEIGINISETTYNTDCDIEIFGSIISGSSNVIYTQAGAPDGSLLIGSTQLAGGPISVWTGISPITCGDIIDENYIHYASTCP